MRQWFQVVAKADDTSAVDIHIIDVIGGWDDDWIARNWGYDMGVTARSFVESLAKLGDAVKTLNVHINSPGGDVFSAANIANALREQQLSKGRTVHTFVDGIAASAASVIAMAGSKVHMADNGLMMIHNPWSIAIGSAAEMRKSADVLDTIRATIVATYKWHSTLDDAAIAELMDAETWMSADEAIERGFATDKVAGLQAQASIDKRSMAKLKVPDQFKARIDALLKPEAKLKAAASASDVLRECTAAGCLELAENFITLGYALDDVRTEVAEEKQRRADASARATSIQKLCANARIPQLADGYIAGGMTLDQVKAQLVIITAARDNVEIDGTLKPDQGTRGAKGSSNVFDIYAERNGLTKKET